MDEFNSKEYKKSRVAYAAQCTFEYFVTLLVADAFLAKLLTAIGMSDSMIGVISSFISFSFLFQLLSIFLIKKMKNVKKTVIIFDTISQLLFMSMYCLPFLKVDKSIKILLMIAAILLAYFFKYIITSIYFKWANSYVNPKKRGVYSSVKEMISLFCGMVFSLSVGFVIDRFEAFGNICVGFLFIALVMLALNVFNFISIMMIKNEQNVHQNNNIGFSNLIKNTLGNKKFQSVIVLTSLWEIARYISIGFMGTFKTNDLMISVGIVQVINSVASVLRLVFSVPIGKYSDKKSYAKGFELAFFIAAAGFFINIFTTSSTWWLIAVFTVLYNVSLAGTNANTFNITYSYVKNEYIVQAMAIRSSISGVLGFLASLLGSWILTYVQKQGNTIFGIAIYGQQILSAISFVIIVCAIIYDKCVVEKQKTMLQ